MSSMLGVACTAGAGATRTVEPHRVDSGRPPAVILVPESLQVSRSMRHPGGRVVWVPGSSMFQPSLSRSLERALTFYRDFEFSASLALVAETLRSVEGRGLRDDLQFIRRLHMVRAMNEAALGRDEGASDSLRVAGRLGEPAADEGALYPPVLLERLRGLQAARPTLVPVTIEPDPPSAHVSIDGQVVDAGVEVAMAVGSHYLHLASPGYEPQLVRVVVQRARSIEISLERATSRLAAQQVIELGANGTSRLSRAQRHGVARALSMFEVVVVHSDEEHVRVSSVFLPTGQINSAAEAIDASGGKKSALLRALARVVPETDPMAADPAPETGSTWTSAWFWTGAAALVVAAGIVGFAVANDEGDTRLTIHPSP